jgi:hypothetical protein
VIVVSIVSIVVSLSYSFITSQVCFSRRYRIGSRYTTAGGACCCLERYWTAKDGALKDFFVAIAYGKRG